MEKFFLTKVTLTPKADVNAGFIQLNFSKLKSKY